MGWRTWLPWGCQPEFSLVGRRRFDYALFDRGGEAVVLIQNQPLPARRAQDRARLQARVRAMTRGVAVLFYGWEWAIYDLERRTRSFAERRVERLAPDHDAPDNVADVAAALCQWLGKDQWRRRAEVTSHPDPKELSTKDVPAKPKLPYPNW